MSGTAKWLIVGSVVVMALATLVALSLFAWMVFRSPMMGSAATGWGTPRMGYGFERAWTRPMNPGTGMMGGGAGMMGDRGYGYSSSAPTVDEGFTFEVVEKQIENFFGSREDLAIAEIMIFDNHAYVEIIETDTGIGAMELLVDPQTLNVYPEHGPNMMWNTKYGMHGGGMMGIRTEAGDMTVSPEEAMALAQAYLDRNSLDQSVDDHAAEFYGYYTLHTLQDGEVVGMLSVNGYTGEVFLHTWHGTLLDMSEVEHE